MPRQASTHVDSPDKVGQRLREARERAGLTQRELAFPGCTPAYISRVEAGMRVPSLQILRRLGEELGVSADYLATGTDPGALDPLDEARLALQLHDVDRAETLYAETLAGSPDAVVAARARVGMGQIAFLLGDHDGAARAISEALAVGGALPRDERTEAQDTLGRARAMLGEYEVAFAVFETALEEARNEADLLDVLRFTVLLANAHADGGNFGRASELLASAIQDIAAVDDPLAQARLWWTQSRLHTLQNRPDLAARYARLALASVQIGGHAGYVIRAYQLLAHIENDRGNPTEALALLERGEIATAATGNAYETGLYELEKARALLALGRTEEAGSVAMATQAVFAAASPIDAGRGYSLIADVYRELGDSARALELYELAAETLPVADRYLVHVLRAMAEIYEAEGDTDRALRALKDAVEAGTAEQRPSTVA